MKPRLLILDHHHPSGRHGIGADVRVAEELGVHVLPVPTCLALGPADAPERLNPLPWRTLRRLLDVAMEEDPVTVLVGLLARKRQARMVGEYLREHAPPGLIVSPLSLAFDVQPLLGRNTLETVRKELFNENVVVLPATQTGPFVLDVEADVDGMKAVARKVMDDGARAVWLRDASHEGRAVDVLADHKGIGLLDYPPPEDATLIHLAPAALAAYVALGVKLREAVDRAHRHVYGLDQITHRVVG